MRFPRAPAVALAASLVAFSCAFSPAARAQEDAEDAEDARVPEDPEAAMRLSRSRFDVDTPRLPAPLAMPELGHANANAGVEWTVGAGIPSADNRDTSALGLIRAVGETWVGPQRRLYVGATVPLAAGLPPDGSGGSKVVLGNLEAHVRVTFPQPTWLAFGATLGVVTPTATFDRTGPAASAALAAISFDPTDVSYFTPGIVALRPAYDLRIIRGPVVVQARQGLDIAIDTAGARPVSTNARLLLHVGVLARRDLEASLEATQLYLFGADVPDKKRNALSIGPGFRYTMGKVDLGMGVVTNVFSALSPTVDRVIGIRFSVIGHVF